MEKIKNYAKPGVFFMEKWAIGVAKKDMEIVAVNTSKETIM